MWRRGRRRADEVDRETIPDLPSIYDHIRRNLEPDGSRLTEEGHKLPDERYQKARHGGGIGFAPGAVDGILRHAPLDREEIARESRRLHEAVLEFANNPTAQSEENIVHLLVKRYAATSVPLVMKRLSERPVRNPERLYERMRKLLLQSGHREVVKFAIAIAASFRKQQDLEVFRMFARHPEFTMYAADAVMQSALDPISDLMTLAKMSESWGKVNLIERLLGSDRSDVKDYLLREGIQDVSNLEGYLALPIATQCKLHEALEDPTIDRRLIQGAAEILQVLTYEAVDGGPNGNILDYPEGGLAAERFLPKFEPIASSPRDFLTVWSIRQFVSADTFDDRRLQAAGWDSERRAHILEACDRILAAPEWVQRAKLALNSTDSTVIWQGLTMARTLGIPLHDYFVDRIRKDPLDYSMWFQFVWGADEKRMDAALQLAREVLDFESIATGPAVESLVSPGHERHNCVNYLLQELRRFPGKGWEVIHSALQSPVTTNRTFALFALKMWRATDTTEAILQAVTDALNDPSDHVRTAAKEVWDMLGRSLPG